MTEGHLIVVSGPSGVGKGTLIAEVVRRRPELSLSVSWTTRPRRPGERDGVHYRFVDEAVFREGIASGDLLEWEEYRGALYGTPWSEVRRALDQGRDLVLEIDVRGAKSVKERFPQAVTIFIEPPSPDALEIRLRKRGTDTEDQIRARLEAAQVELLARDDFDYVVLNDEVDEAADAVIAILDGLPSAAPVESDQEHP